MRTKVKSEHWILLGLADKIWVKAHGASLVSARVAAMLLVPDELTSLYVLVGWAEGSVK